MGRRKWEYTPEFRACVVKEFRTRGVDDGIDRTARGIANRYNLTPGMVYQWARQAITKEEAPALVGEVDVRAFPVESEGIQITNMRIRGKVNAAQVVALLRERGKAPSWYDPENGYHFVSLYCYANHQVVGDWVKLCLPDVAPFVEVRGAMPKA